jgi:adrenodoxin-NADP+ reductase
VFFPSIPSTLFLDDLNSLPRPRRRIAELLIKSGKLESAAPSFPKRFQLDFLLKPISFASSPTAPTELATASFQPTQYTDPATLSSPAAAVQPNPTLTPQTFPTSVALRSIGYKASPLPGLSALKIPFDSQRGIIPNRGGRVLREHDLAPAIANPAELEHLVVPGIYVAGWVKRGPTGVIASTMEDAFQTADAVLADWGTGMGFLNEGGGTGLGWEGVRVDFERNGGRWTDWTGWRVIDSVERERGRASGKVREKITAVEEMLRVLGK